MQIIFAIISGLIVVGLLALWFDPFFWFIDLSPGIAADILCYGSLFALPISLLAACNQWKPASGMVIGIVTGQVLRRFRKKPDPAEVALADAKREVGRLAKKARRKRDAWKLADAEYDRFLKEQYNPAVLHYNELVDRKCSREA